MAVSLYHQRRGNFRGASKLMSRAIDILKKEKEALLKLSFDYSALMSLLTERLHEIEEERPYRSMNLPIVSEKLLTMCKQKCERQGVTWGTPSNLKNEYIVHKHLLRGSSTVK